MTGETGGEYGVGRVIAGLGFSEILVNVGIRLLC